MLNLRDKITTRLKNMKYLASIGHLIKWGILGSIMGILTGTASAFFLYSLEIVTNQRISHPWLLYLLPIGGTLVSFIYIKYGKNSLKGNNLIIEQCQNGKEEIPLRMGVMALFGTLVTHLFGGSAGREGTAVQMGGTLAEFVGKVFHLDATDRKILLMSGISSGFGSVFGTPLAGTVFGMEVVTLGFLHYEALIPCFTASFVGNIVTTSWGVHHTKYPIMISQELTLMLLLKIIIAAIFFGFVSIIFSELTHTLKQIFSKLFQNPMIKSAVGGLIIIFFVYLLGTRDYLGLSIPLIVRAFDGEVSMSSFLWKLLLTSITLGTGFQGGEVTPLFVIGSTLGCTLSVLLHLPASFLASLGFIAVFAGAANTPVACFLMGIELFGGQGAIYLFLTCIISYLISGHHGIYTAQMIGTSKNKTLSFQKNSTLSSLK